MHLDTKFLEFEFLDYDNVKPLKDELFHNLDLAFTTFFDMTLKCIACV
jgi:hypothetical protein